MTGRAAVRLRLLDIEGLRALTLSILYEAAQGEAGIRSAMDRVFCELDEGFEKGYNVFILSDRGVDAEHAAIPSMLAVSGGAGAYPAARHPHADEPRAGKRRTCLGAITSRR